ncbi:MAG TPA: SMI1/KNR4 family protein, partial [Minicystis sp.]|nr:SMI1/KNR4 family protein [Minicystis sp.]
MTWRAAIAAIRSKKLELARLDPRRGMPVLPPVGATPRQIEGAERKLGRALPPSYRELLAVHDGWPELLHGASLLSAHHLARGMFDGVARSVIDVGDRPAELVAFGADTAGETVFAWDASRPRDDGELEVV